MPKDVTLTTSDGLKIAADVYESDGDKFAILLHMMPATKESWESFAGKLAQVDYTSIAIDERGHGESTQGGELQYEDMPDIEQQNKIRDVEAAFDYLQDTYDAKPENVVVIGASIGANLTIRFLPKHPDILVGIALSPGINYHGVTVNKAVQALHDGQQLILVASDDDRRSFEAIHALEEKNPERIEVIERSGIGHGTTMTDKQPELIDELIEKLP
jgi:alpha-beta hydrolase superfamily lysophospholipase